MENKPGRESVTSGEHALGWSLILLARATPHLVSGQITGSSARISVLATPRWPVCMQRDLLRCAERLVQLGVICNVAYNHPISTWPFAHNTPNERQMRKRLKPTAAAAPHYQPDAPSRRRPDQGSARAPIPPCRDQAPVLVCPQLTSQPRAPCRPARRTSGRPCRHHQPRIRHTAAWNGHTSGHHTQREERSPSRGLGSASFACVRAWSHPSRPSCSWCHST
jgi:hypothetical protein